MLFTGLKRQCGIETQAGEAAGRRFFEAVCPARPWAPTPEQLYRGPPACPPGGPLVDQKPLDEFL